VGVSFDACEKQDAMGGTIPATHNARMTADPYDGVTRRETLLPVSMRVRYAVTDNTLEYGSQVVHLAWTIG
jgi:hypothetical protein